MADNKSGISVHRDPGNRNNPWVSVVMLGIVAVTTVSCGWGLVFYLLNK